MESTKRFKSLDVFRGMTIAFMILVNTPGSWGHVYAPLLHADWNGCTPTDLVFPFFMYIVGVAMFFSFSKYNYQLTPALRNKILKRTALIFLIGLLLNWFPFYNKNITDLRILGVLQRIALGYGAAAFLCIFFKRKSLVIVSIALLLGYWLLLWLGGGNAPYALETNLVRKLDLMFFGESHVWKGKGIPFDPEGLLSTMPSIVTVILGYFTGAYIKENQASNYFIRNIIIAGIIGIVAGLMWGMFFPINKSLWTSSYVLYTAGIGIIMLAIMIWLIDIKKIDGWTMPLLVFGSNSLLAYVLSGLWTKILFMIKITQPEGDPINGYAWLYENVFKSMAGALNGSLLFAIFSVLVVWIICFVLYKKKIFVKI